MQQKMVVVYYSVYARAGEPVGVQASLDRWIIYNGVVWVVTNISRMFGLKKCPSRNVLVWKLLLLYLVTEHACLNAGAIGLLREASLNK